ncbi:collagen alpha-1(I) chain-like isoform X2 [Manis pentadactyla]|uniref:collagen alpha-1(I) chain-like isoform X2 n=1 Tax=Manis pentadactyla TaxID=143292 RepID=UPI00255C67A3|nr:collagen alpha-1(I) chain-like isoform X2 [Manis pentadactyla]
MELTHFARQLQVKNAPNRGVWKPGRCCPPSARFSQRSHRSWHGVPGCPGDRRLRGGAEAGDTPRQLPIGARRPVRPAPVPPPPVSPARGSAGADRSAPRSQPAARGVLGVVVRRWLLDSPASRGGAMTELRWPERSPRAVSPPPVPRPSIRLTAWPAPRKGHEAGRGRRSRRELVGDRTSPQDPGGRRGAAVLRPGTCLGHASLHTGGKGMTSL